jgi:predicted Fe-Mo cluster-binding NifX family protein
MKIAIPLAGGKCAMHFGHCQEFALIEVDEEKKTVTGKQNAPAPDHQPGLFPRFLNEQGVNVIISGGMGSRAQAMFAQNNITVVTGASSESPEKIVMDYLNGTLDRGENICDH